MENNALANENLEKLFGKLMDDEKLAEKFSQIDDMDELYEFSVGIVDGYTKEEFKKYVSSVMEYADKEIKSLKKAKLDLNKVVGGATGRNKVASAAIAALMAGSSIPMNAAFAEGGRETAAISDTGKPSMWEKLKGNARLAGETIGGALLAGTLLVAKKLSIDLDRKEDERFALEGDVCRLRVENSRQRGQIDSLTNEIERVRAELDGVSGEIYSERIARVDEKVVERVNKIIIGGKNGKQALMEGINRVKLCSEGEGDYTLNIRIGDCSEDFAEHVVSEVQKILTYLYVNVSGRFVDLDQKKGKDNIWNSYKEDDFNVVGSSCKGAIEEAIEDCCNRDLRDVIEGKRSEGATISDDIVKDVYEAVMNHLSDRWAEGGMFSNAGDWLQLAVKWEDNAALALGLSIFK